MTSGIYKIVNKVNDKLYVGSAINIKKRWRLHKFHLNKVNHENHYLQNAWNKYKEENFQFVIIEEIKYPTKEILLEREQFYLDSTLCYERNNGYNICRFAGNMLGFKHNDITKQKISDSHKGEKHHLYGKERSEEVKQKLRVKALGRRHTLETKNKIEIATRGESNPSSILNWKKVREIREKYNSGKYSQRQLYKEYEISKSQVNKIINNKCWKEDII